MRKVNARQVVEARILAVLGGFPGITVELLEKHYLAGGSVKKPVQAMIAARRAEVQLDWPTASALDISGRDVLAAVQEIVAEKLREKANTRR